MAAVVAACVCIAATCADEPQTPDAHRLHAALQRLDADDYAVRRAAEKELLSAGQPAVAPLQAAAESASPEALERMLAVLEQIFAGEPGAASDAAERALDELTRSEHPHVAQGAAVALFNHHRLREERAVAAIRELGGRVDFGIDQAALDLMQGVAPDARFVKMPLRIEKIWLMDGWTGGEEGLWHLRRLSHLPNIDLYSIRGNGVTADAVQELAALLPNVRISERGKASLGVGGTSIGECRVNQVMPGGAAEKAGIRTMDVITRLGDQPVERFADLVNSLAAREPGETVSVQVRRMDPLSGVEVLTEIDVELSGWRELQTQDDRDSPLFPRLDLRK